MAYRQNAYQYETSPRKLKPEYEEPKNPYSKKKKSILKEKNQTIQKNNNKETNKQDKKTIKAHIKTALYIAVVFAILFAISYRHSLITESFNNNEKLKKELGVLQKENAQTEISIQGSLNLANIQKSASEMLGMQKIEESQKVYVNLPKKDYVEQVAEQINKVEQKRWYEKMFDSFLELIK